MSSYVKHNFQDEQVLYAAKLNEMDNQIAQNQSDIKSLQESSVSSGWELIAEVQLTEEKSVIDITTDKNGSAFNLCKAMFKASVIGGSDLSTNSEYQVKSHPSNLNATSALIYKNTTGLRSTAQMHRAMFVIDQGVSKDVTGTFAEQIQLISGGQTGTGAATDVSYKMREAGDENNIITNIRFDAGTNKFGIGTHIYLWGVRA